MNAADVSGGCDLGVAIVTFQSEEIIGECLDCLFASAGAKLRVVVVDNASSDATLEVIGKWAASRAPEISFAQGAVGEIACASADLTVLRSPVNGGFAYGTNRAIEALMGDKALDLFWLVNPDARVLPAAAALFAKHGADGAFSLMGGRTLFAERPDFVQTDGGKVSRLTGVCQSVNWGRTKGNAAMPQAGELDYITGANCVVSRAFVERAGLMEEDYFLYYEEVDWAFKRGDLPLRLVPEAQVLHLGGTSIGTGAIGRLPSPFSNYFNYRNRMRFMRRFRPLALPMVLAFGLAKVVQLLVLGAREEAYGAFAGLLGLAPPQKVRARIAPEAHALAFGQAQ